MLFSLYHSVRHYLYLGISLALLSSSQAAYGFDLNEKLGAEWQQDEFLPANLAFPFTVTRESTPNSDISLIHIDWEITEGYYLYAETVQLTYNNDSSDNNAQAPIELPSAEFSRAPLVKYDPNFDKDMAIFKGQVTATFKISNNLASTENLKDSHINFQGCAEAGLCYPMQQHRLLDRLNITQPNLALQSNRTEAINTNISRNIVSEAKINTQLNNKPTQAKQSHIEERSTAYTESAQSFSDKFDFSVLLSQASLMKIIVVFLLLGIGLCFTPCVLPMMPIISGLVLGRDKALSSTQAFGISTTYVLSMSLSYTVVGVLAASLGASANIQIWMQHPVILSVFAILFVLLALSMFDVYELRLPNSLNQKLSDLSNKQKSGSYIGAAIMGVLSAVVVSPCISAPLAGALVFISSTGDALIGATALFSLGIGMGLPLILLCTLGTNILPKAGTWLNYSKRFFGILLIAVAVWMLSRFINPQLSLALWGSLLIFTSFSFGLWQNSHALLRTTLTLCLLWGIIMLVGAALGNSQPLQPLKNITLDKQDLIASTYNTPNTTSSAKAVKPSFKVIQSIDQLNIEIEKNRASGKILLLDFYADWCTTCKEIEHQIFENPRFENFLSSTHLVLADLSNNSKENFELLESMKLFGPPAILFFNDGGNELKEFRVQGPISPDQFQELIYALRQNQ